MKRKEHMHEIFRSMISYQRWWTLAIFDLKQRYRRSILGPLWITLSMGITVLALGFLWSTIFKTQLKEFMPFFATSLVLWTFISSQINEGCIAYIQYESYIKQINIPLPLYILRIWARNLIMLAHNSIILILIWFYFGFSWMPNIFTALLGLFIIVMSILFISIPLAIICTRFRDVTQIVQSVMQILYFFTPVIWQPELLPVKYSWIVNWNPLFHMFEVFRAPLLEKSTYFKSWGWSIGVLLVSLCIAILMHNRYRNRITYWL